MAAAVVNQNHHHYMFSTLTRFSFNSTTPTRTRRRESHSVNRVRCSSDIASSTSENRVVTLSNGNDSLNICRVLNGMWQTGGGWGRIDRNDAVEAMLRYADAGLSTFDMADHCTLSATLSYGSVFSLLELRTREIDEISYLFVCLLNLLDVIDRHLAVCKLEMSELLRICCSKFTFNPKGTPTRRAIAARKHKYVRPIQCVRITETEEDNRCIVVKNGKDSLDICRVVNGMWQTSGGWGTIDRNNAVDAMLKYADAGLTTFDMADIYGPAEDLYGIFINRVRRERPPEFLEKVRGLTKWVPPPVKMTSSYVRDSINVSRKRMDVDSLDMLQFHWWDYSNPGYLDALKHLTDLKEEGKIKTVALTNFDTERLQIILENEIPVVSNQVQHSIVDMRPQQRMAELCQLTGVKLITYGTVMGGLLSEKFVDTNITIPFAGPAINTPSLQKYKRMVDAWGGWSLFQGLLRTLKQVASKHGVSIATVAVKYILDQPAVAGSMVGVRLGLSEHIQDCNAIFSLVLDEDDVSSIREATRTGKDLLKVIGDCGDEYRRA
ncbi:hypothetical protein RIF29_27538 [Crotalaria pallida]|uniref:NADP-dependent oxidoreductase domain-containing protein n=1 Tax=Crotalaria pallida TaxID=3830 RepID=A0AAN9HYU8_CROPI